MRDYYSSDSAPRLLLIIITLFLALTLEFLPWPAWLVKPLFPDMALIYWAMYRPRVVNYGVAVVLGVMMDLATRLPLGFTALSYTAMVMLVNVMRGRFSLLGSVGKAVHIFFILACGQFILFMLEILDNGLWSQLSWSYFVPSVVTAVLWMFMPLLLEMTDNLMRSRRRGE